jgi:hypothetical protein
MQLSTNKKYIETIIATVCRAAYNTQHSPVLESIKFPNKCIAAEDTSRDPNTNFIYFTNFNNVTIYVLYI